MMKKATFLFLLSLLCMSAAFSQEAAGRLFKYDDDNSDVNFALMSGNEGQQVGMHYDVGSELQTVDSVSIFVSAGKIDNVKANIRIVKLDENNSEIVIPFEPSDLGKWNEVSLADRKIDIRGNVMIALEWVTPTGEVQPFSSFFIGADSNVGNHNGYIKHPGGDWYPARRFGSSGAKNFYIRLITQKM